MLNDSEVHLVSLIFVTLPCQVFAWTMAGLFEAAPTGLVPTTASTLEEATPIEAGRRRVPRSRFISGLLCQNGSVVHRGRVRCSYCSRRVNRRYEDGETLVFTRRSASRCLQRRRLIVGANPDPTTSGLDLASPVAGPTATLSQKYEVVHSCGSINVEQRRQETERGHGAGGQGLHLRARLIHRGDRGFDLHAARVGGHVNLNVVEIQRMTQRYQVGCILRRHYSGQSSRMDHLEAICIRRESCQIGGRPDDAARDSASSGGTLLRYV